MRCLFSTIRKGMQWRGIGPVSLILGIAFLGYAHHSMKKVNEAKGVIDKTTDFFSHNPSVWNPLIEFFGGKAQREASKYDVFILILFIIGIILVVFGLFALIRLLIGAKKK